MLPSMLLALVEGVPNWVWVAIGAGLFLLALLAIVLVVRSRRGAAPADDGGLGWDDAPAEPLPEPAAVPHDPGFHADAAFSPPVPDPAAEAAPAPAATSADVHYCRCPACGTQFTVNGAKPIVTNCPGCGKKGYLR